MNKEKATTQNSDRLINEKTPKVTVDDVLGYIGYGPFQVVAFCMVGLTMLAHGFNISLFSFIGISVQKQWNLTGIQFAIIPSVTGATNIIGGFTYGYTSDHFGRVWPYVVPLLNVGIFGLASAFSPSFATLVVLRAISGLAVTGIFSIAITTLTEFLPVSNRGTVIVLLRLTEAVGSCLCAGLAWWLIPTHGVNGWRFLIVTASIPFLFAAVFRLIFHFQSPRYLIARGRSKAARRVLSRMACVNGKALSGILPAELEFEELVAIETQTGRTLWQTALNFKAIFMPPYLRTTVLMSIVYTLQGMSSYGASLFLPSILSRLNVNPYFTAFIGYLGRIPGILLMSIIVEWRHVGRLNSLRFFTLLTVVSFLLFAFVQNEVTIPVFTILIYFSMVPINSVLNTYISEYYSTSIRTLALVFFSNLQALFEIFIPFVSGYVSDISIPWLYPVVWAGLFGFQFFMSLFLNFETLGIRLSDSV